jgi:hypothetical protein
VDHAALDDSLGPPDRGLRELLRATWISLLLDSPFDPVKPKRLVNRFIADLADLDGLLQEYSDLSQLLLDSLSLSQDHPLTRALFVRMKRTPVLREYLHFIRTDDPRSLRYLLSFLAFGKKVRLLTEGLEDAALRGWIDVEERLQSLTLPDWVDNLKAFILFFLEEWDPEVFLPIHGSGCVSERSVSGPNEKCIHSGSDRLINFVFRNEGKDLDLSLYAPLDILSSRIRGDLAALDGFEITATNSRTSRLKFVPKTFKSLRSICMEPIVNMWAQQGVRLWLEYAMEHGPLSNHVFLRDQTKNQDGARFGSKTGLVDTIDLSSASDSVSWNMIRRIFPSHVLKYFACTRTNKTELPSGEIHTLEKFAPMGSALCFPTQCLVYSALVSYVSIARNFGLNWRDKGCLDLIDVRAAFQSTFRRRLVLDDPRSRFQPFLVFGDDIICDSLVTEDVISALGEIGFTVNRGKSFIGDSPIRESCGIYAYKGYDVTPCLFRANFTGTGVNADELVGLVSLSNRLYSFGFEKASSTVQNFALRVRLNDYHKAGKSRSGLNPILFSLNPDEEHLALYSSQPRNHHLDGRFNVDLQRDEILAIGMQQTASELVDFDEYRHTAWWRSSVTSGESSVSSSWKQRESWGSTLRLGWVPVWK